MDVGLKQINRNVLVDSRTESLELSVFVVDEKDTSPEIHHVRQKIRNAGNVGMWDTS